MKRAAAQGALDEAFADGLKHAFGVLMSNIVAGDPDAGKKFERAIGANDDAHAAASAVIDKIFED